MLGQHHDPGSGYHTAPVTATPKARFKKQPPRTMHRRGSQNVASQILIVF